ncbi:MAG: lytic transglycosylase domain-containing protein [Pseudomonadota bacterium]|nr:lytic transglycosylase domain-containing protein [Pseudomonadota bacterium]
MGSFSQSNAQRYVISLKVGLLASLLVSTLSHADTIRRIESNGTVTLTNKSGQASSSARRNGGSGQYAYVMQNENGENLLTNISRSRPEDDPFREFNRQVKKTFYPESNIHQYKNWGATEASVPKSSSRNQNAFDHLITAAAQRHNLDPALMKAIMHTESGFNPNARSPVGAQGLMQLMPATARRFNVTNAWDPEQNIEGSAKYLRWLLNRFKGRVEHVLAGYNAGEGNVDKYGGIPPFRETQDYVRRVLSRYNNLYANQNLQAQSNSSTRSDQRPVTLAALTSATTNNISDSAYTQTALEALESRR